MPSAPPTKVLIVDDAVFLRTVLKDILANQEMPYEVYEAADGMAAIEAYKRLRPDIVTMDFNMPKMDGIQALKEIMKINQDAKVIMITSAEQRHVVQDAMKFGARDFVVKPFDRSNVGFVFSKVVRLGEIEIEGGNKWLT
jgi:two-component system, chemotaxis family, chemotaxis protein CheY